MVSFDIRSVKELLILIFPITIVYYVPRRIIRVITRRATMPAEDRSRGAIGNASILSESRNYPNCEHWHIFYFMCLRRENSFYATVESSVMLCIMIQTNVV